MNPTQDEQPAIVIIRGDLSRFAGRDLTDEEIERIKVAWPNSTIPEAFGVIADSLTDHCEPTCEDQ